MDTEWPAPLPHLRLIADQGEEVFEPYQDEGPAEPEKGLTPPIPIRPDLPLPADIPEF